MIAARRNLLKLFAFAAFLAPFEALAGDADFPVSTLEIATESARHRFTVEVAATPELRSLGLQHRREMALDAGMLFDFKVERRIAMWMKNTHLSLDMLFVDGAGRIVRVAENAVPGSLDLIPSSRPVKAVVELNAGTAKRLGIAVGDRVIHPIFTSGAR